jgi:hypothetical protein
VTNSYPESLPIVVLFITTEHIVVLGVRITTELLVLCFVYVLCKSVESYVHEEGLYHEGPRSRHYGRVAALTLLVQPCDEDDDDYYFLSFS